MVVNAGWIKTTVYLIGNRFNMGTEGEYEMITKDGLMIKLIQRDGEIQIITGYEQRDTTKVICRLEPCVAEILGGQMVYYAKETQNDTVHKENVE